ncbi:mammalian cell entry protein [Mycobacterium sp. OTB74]|jgi:Mce-associated membrane protein|uniref:mammalian cell entry protein n=1 Tax=Mycobacterium sp. OTB74 TaxID=1853452 RepID=UPI0024749D68|nr:mammalian cell entry protein [Mycobacterium sp. OTB74]MDH6246401.1 Mce-associated membrane protein [Mycobacterium sp. OTB74]
MQVEQKEAEPDVAIDDDVVECVPEADSPESDDEPEQSVTKAKKPRSVLRTAALVCLAAAVVLAALIGWFGYRAHQSSQVQVQRTQFLAAARQGALNLTTIDWQKADADVQRILDGATGQFRDDFAARSKPFIDVVKQAKSSSVGTVSEAGIESQDGDTAQVLVAVGVQTSNAGAPKQDPRSWRMRIAVQKVGDQIKVSNVEFVP